MVHIPWKAIMCHRGERLHGEREKRRNRQRERATTIIFTKNKCVNIEFEKRLWESERERERDRKSRINIDEEKIDRIAYIFFRYSGLFQWNRGSVFAAAVARVLVEWESVCLSVT